MPYHGRGPLPASRDAKKPLPSVRERLFGMEGPRRGGNTWSATSAHHTSAVHPHVCGEYARAMLNLLSMDGSSPRVWGILHGTRERIAGGRFIPTRVGNTLRPVCDQLRPSVHPHACGEYRLGYANAVHAAGSSPRVWGILISACSTQHKKRFIPTRVGNTSQRPSTSSGGTVHPHACGEYLAAITEWPWIAGSSPRVWGIHF